MTAPAARRVEPSSEVPISVTVNGAAVDAVVPARQLLVDFIREKLRLTGTHVGCEQGICGACPINVDGEPVRSCIMLAAQVDGSVLTTVEGLSSEGLNPLQQAFKENHGLQCGFCTPGFPDDAVLPSTPDEYPGEDGIREAVSGNLCRCHRATPASCGQCGTRGIEATMTDTSRTGRQAESTPVPTSPGDRTTCC